MKSSYPNDSAVHVMGYGYIASFSKGEFNYKAEPEYHTKPYAERLQNLAKIFVSDFVTIEKKKLDNWDTILYS